MDAVQQVYRVERGPVGSHRGYIVHVAIDRSEQLVDRLVLLLASLVEPSHQVAIHFDGLADVQKSARSACENSLIDALSEGVSLEVVHSHRDQIELRIGVLVEKSERHDADSRFEREEIALVVRSALRKDRHALVLRQCVPHRGEHLMVVDMRRELKDTQTLREGVRKHGRIRILRATRAWISPL